MFRQTECIEQAYIYEVSNPDVKKPYYEAFRRNENDYFGVISYPRSKAFGLWAYIYPTLELARQKLAEIIQLENMPDLHIVSDVLAS